METVKSFKYLGVIINHNGKWENQSKQVKLIGNSAFNSIIRLRNKLPNVKSKLMFDTYRALVESRMLYGVEVWGSINTETVMLPRDAN